MRARILVLVMLLFVPTAAVAAPISSTVTGSVVTVQYTEPTQNAPDINGIVTPLTDLAGTTVYCDKGQGPVSCAQVQATSPTGGGNITTNVSVPVQAGETVTVTFTATATDTSGNESASSASTSKVIDRIPPAPPQ